MKPVVKRRLLIALIIIALIIIFLPIPFGHFKLKKDHQAIQNIPPVPNQPSVQTVPQPGDAANNNAGFIPTQSQNNVADGSAIVSPNTQTTPSTTPASSVPTDVSPVQPAQSATLTNPLQTQSTDNAAVPGPSSAAATSPTMPAVSDAAGNGKLPNYTPVDPIPDTDGSNKAPLAGDDVKLPTGPKIIDETQSNSAASASVDTSDTGLALKSPASSTSTTDQSATPYHVRTDDTTSGNVVTKQSAATSAALVGSAVAMTSHPSTVKKVALSNKPKTINTTAHVTHHATLAKSKTTTQHVVASKHPVAVKKAIQEKTAVKTTSTKVTASAANKSWVIQTGSFMSEVQAQNKVDQLTKQGHTAFVGEATVKGRKVYRAYVGPFVSQDRAEKVLHVIDQKSHVKGYIHSFEAQ